MKIILYVENSFNYAKLSLLTLLNCTDDEIIVVDNGSEDDFKTWAEANPGNYTLLYDDNGPVKPGKLLNDTIECLNLEDDLLLIDSHIAITLNSLNEIKELMDQEEIIGAVGPLCNSFKSSQKLYNVKNYSECLELDNNTREKNNITYELGLCSEAIAITHNALSVVGKFDEDLVFYRDVIMMDYCLRINMKGLRCIVSHNSFFWDMRGTDFIISTDYEINRLSEKWGMTYFNMFGNKNIVDAINEKTDRELHILEVGCDLGATLIMIKNRYINAHIYGVDINESAVKIAKTYMNAQACNIEDRNINFDGIKFDYIVFGDVLEHLRNPEDTIDYCHSLLNEGGKIIASIPNLMNISVISDLIEGNFTYTNTGLLDRTHIHMFTYNEIIKMFELKKYKVLDVYWTSLNSISEKDNMIIESLLSFSENAKRWMYEAFQYIIIAQSDI